MRKSCNDCFYRPEVANEIAETSGHQVLFSTPYAPDGNKIEHDFAALKKVLADAPDDPMLDEVMANYRYA